MTGLDRPRVNVGLGYLSRRRADVQPLELASRPAKAIEGWTLGALCAWESDLRAAEPTNQAAVREGLGTQLTDPEEIKIEAVKKITERGRRVADESAQIGVSQPSQQS